MTTKAATDIFAQKVTVCGSCLTVACLNGEFPCAQHKTAGTVQRAVADLLARHREHPRYWQLENDAEIRRIFERRDREA